jgi:hypothetical protein
MTSDLYDGENALKEFHEQREANLVKTVDKAKPLERPNTFGVVQQKSLN